MKLTSYTFSFQDLLSSDQAQNERWVQLMEVLDQLFEEFVYPEIERTKNLKSVYTANEKDLDAIYRDKYYYLYENILASVGNKRIAIWLTSEIVKAKNRDDSILLAVASLGLPRSALTLKKYYSKKEGEYSSSSLRVLEQVEDSNKYFLTSRTGYYLDQTKLENLGINAVEAQDAVKNVLSENVVPVHIDLQIMLELQSSRSDIKVISSIKPFHAVFQKADNTGINYKTFSAISEMSVICSIKSHSQYIV